ncbi:MAG: hypothetical protein ACR2KT_07495 [Methylocella sp.]
MCIGAVLALEVAAIFAAWLNYKTLQGIAYLYAPIIVFSLLQFGRRDPVPEE